MNYYQLGATLSGHTDHSEDDLAAPLISIRCVCACACMCVCVCACACVCALVALIWNFTPSLELCNVVL